MKTEFNCQQCSSKLIKVFHEPLPRPKRLVYFCPACSHKLYNERTTDNVTIKLNEK